jgi:hypothetical protein
MVAARHELLITPVGPAPDADHGFAGEWLLDRIHGLMDATHISVQRVRLDARSLHIDLRVRESQQVLSVTAELNGYMVEVRSDLATCAVQALLEGDALIWELEHHGGAECTRVRRVMHLSKQGSQLIAERVDMNADGVPLVVRTEYWTRAGSPPL